MSEKTLSQLTLESFPNDLTFIQSRAEINLATVDEYAQMMKDGVTFDPGEGVQDESGNIYIFDGTHRGEAAKRAGVTLLVNLRPGNRTEAEWLALTANQKHGLRRTNKDKQRVVRQALLHPYGVNLSNSELARHCGVNDKTVAKIRREMELSSEIPKMDKRVVQRNGVTYEQDTRQIGNSKPQGKADVPRTATPSKSLSPFQHGTVKSDEIRSPDSTNQLLDVLRPTHELGVAEPSPYHPQEFECPRCRQEKIVGVNGSRRWCLNCLAEWPTSTEFLAEVQAAGTPDDRVPTHAELQDRFLNILGQLDERDPRLSQIKIWLNDLEGNLDLSRNHYPANETLNSTVTPNPLPVLEYA